MEVYKFSICCPSIPDAFRHLTWKKTHERAKKKKFLSLEIFKKT